MRAYPQAKCSVFEAMTSRRAVRAFRTDPVERAVVEDILTLAARAPSGSNIQPWKVWAVAGAARDRLCERIVAAFLADEPGYEDEYQYYPRQWSDPYLARRRKVGFDLYQLAGVAKNDISARREQMAQNFTFFGAPVGLFVTIERQMEQGSWMDLGGFIQSILLAARGFGLDTCPQQAFARYHRIIRDLLGIPEEEMIACAIAVGYAEETAPVNQLVTERAPIESFATFRED